MNQKVFRYTRIFLILSSLFQCNPEHSNNAKIFESLLTSISLIQSQNTLNRTGLVSAREINIGLSPINLSNDTITSDGHNSIRLIGDGFIEGGGLLVLVREKMIEEEIDLAVGQPQIPKAPVSIENGIPKFHTIPGKKYEAILDFYIDGANNTEIDGQFIYFLLQPLDTIKSNFSFQEPEVSDCLSTKDLLLQTFISHLSGIILVGTIHKKESSQENRIMQDMVLMIM